MDAQFEWKGVFPRALLESLAFLAFLTSFSLCETRPVTRILCSLTAHMRSVVARRSLLLCTLVRTSWWGFSYWSTKPSTPPGDGELVAGLFGKRRTCKEPLSEARDYLHCCDSPHLRTFRTLRVCLGHYICSDLNTATTTFHRRIFGLELDIRGRQ